MDDSDKRIRERNRGAQAQAILDNPLWAEGFDFYRNTLRAHMEDPSSTDEVVLKARNGLIALSRIQKHMETIFETGKMANISLEEPNG
jgi:hypothetical protein